MFKNMGNKIKTLGKVICWTIISLYALAGIVLVVAGIADNNVWYLIPVGIGTALLGALFGWIGTFFIIGFGELIQSASHIDKLLSNNFSKHETKEFTEETFVITEE